MNIISKIFFFSFCLFSFFKSFSQQKKVMEVSFKEKGFEFFNFSRIKNVNFEGKKSEFHGMTYARGNPIWGCIYLEGDYTKKLFVGNCNTGYLNRNFLPNGYGKKYIYKKRLKFFKKIKFLFKSKNKTNIKKQDNNILIQEGYWVNGKYISKNEAEYNTYLREENVYVKRVAYEIIPYLKHYRKGDIMLTEVEYMPKEKRGYFKRKTEKSNKDETFLVLKMATDSKTPVQFNIFLTAKVRCVIHGFHKYTTKDIIKDKQFPIYQDTLFIFLKPFMFKYHFLKLKNLKKSLVTHYTCDKNFIGSDIKQGKYCARLAKEEEFVSFKLFISKVNGNSVDSLFKK